MTMFFTILLSFYTYFNTPSVSEPLVTEGRHLTKHTKPLQEQESLDISGHWEGTGTRDEGGGKRTVFPVELEVVQKGKEITGVSIVRFENGAKNYQAKMEIKGKLTKTFLSYIETRVMNADSIPNTNWCVKKANLIYRENKGMPTLEGIWDGITQDGKPCTPGRIFLQRRPPRA